MKPYEKYKDTGIKWIGDIPEHWKTSRIGFIGNLYGGLSGKSGSDFINDENLNNKPFIPFTNIFNNKYISKDHFQNVSIHENEKQNLVKKDDLFFLMSSEDYEDLGKCSVLIDDVGELYLNSFCKGLRLNTRNVSSIFLNYLLNSYVYKKIISIEGRGFTRINLRLESLKGTKIIIPPLSEQTQIANYLDKKTAQIDDLIAKKEKLIELLKEERTATINHAVTKGIDPNVPMKDSGIEWLGEIPEHWQIKRIKHTTYVKGRIGWKGLRSDEFLEKSDSIVVTGTDFIEGRVNWETCYQVPKERYDEDPYIQLQEDDLLITKDGTIGKVAVVKDIPKIATLNSGVFVTRPIANDYLQEYMYWILVSDVFKTFYDYNKSGSTIQHLYQNVFDEFKYPKPPLEEQKAISEFIDLENKRLSNLIDKTKTQIELLKEYKTALISEVVTGKVDVRDEKIN